MRFNSKTFESILFELILKRWLITNKNITKFGVILHSVPREIEFFLAKQKLCCLKLSPHRCLLFLLS